MSIIFPLILAAQAGLDDTPDLVGGDGITYFEGTISADINADNLRFTAEQINTIQDIGTTASPEFAGLQLNDFGVAGFVKNDASGVLSGGNSIGSPDISDFVEAAQDAVGDILTDTSTINFNYDDAGNEITASVIPSGIAHNDLSGLSTGDPHTQYSLVDGTRAFTGTVSGVTPTASSHLVTKGYTDGLAQGVDYQDSVIDRNLVTAPGSPSIGDRYIIAGTGGGWAAGTIDDITQWNGSSWIFITPNEGFTTGVEDEDKVYRYNGSSWQPLGSIIDHGALIGLGDDDHTQYYNNARLNAYLSGGNGISYSSGIFTADINTDNLKFTGGNINTIQDIGTGNAPTFDGLNLTGDVTGEFSFTGDINFDEQVGIDGNLTVNNPSTFNDRQSTSVNYTTAIGSSTTVIYDANITTLDFDASVGSSGIANMRAVRGRTILSGNVSGGPTNQNGYGGYFTSEIESHSIDTTNSYGVYASGSANTSGSSTAYGIYAVASGGDTNWAGYFAGSVYASSVEVGAYTASGTGLLFDYDASAGARIRGGGGNILTIQSGVDYIGYGGPSTETYNHEFTGTGYFNSSLAVAGNLTVDSNTFYVNASTNRVGVNDGNPSYSLDVNGDIRAVSDIYTNQELVVGGTTKKQELTVHDTGQGVSYLQASIGTSGSNAGLELFNSSGSYEIQATGQDLITYDRGDSTYVNYYAGGTNYYGIGNFTSPLSTLHIHASNSALSSVPSGTTCILESNSANLLTFMADSGETSVHGINWGDSSDSQIAGIWYQHSTDHLYIYHNNEYRLTIDGDGRGQYTDGSIFSATGDALFEFNSSSARPLVMFDQDNANEPAFGIEGSFSSDGTSTLYSGSFSSLTYAGGFMVQIAGIKYIVPYYEVGDAQ